MSAEPEAGPEAKATPEPEAESEPEQKAEREPVQTQTPRATSAPAPIESSIAQCCFYGGCSSYGTFHCYAPGVWCGASAQNCQSCGGDWCTDVSLVSSGQARQRKFLRAGGSLGTALVQSNTSIFTLEQPRRLIDDADEL